MLREECPADVAATVMQLLNRDPNKRFLMTREVAERIAAWPAHESVDMQKLQGNRLSLLRAVRAVERSLDRCGGDDPKLYQEFYRDALTQSMLKNKWSQLNFDRQVGAVQLGIRKLLDYAIDAGSADVTIVAMARAHRPLKLERAQFQAFIETFICAALRTDSEAQRTSDGNDELRCAYRQALQPGLERLCELCGETPSIEDEPGRLSTSPTNLS